MGYNNKKMSTEDESFPISLSLFFSIFQGIECSHTKLKRKEKEKKERMEGRKNCFLSRLMGHVASTCFNRT